MSFRAVYDTMVFFQWAALPEDRQHATVKALYDGSVRLCMSQALLDEVKDVLSRSEVQLRSPHLTPERLKQVLAAVLQYSDWFAEVPKVFSWPLHTDDDHIFNLAIEAKADYLVTWENRILKLLSDDTSDANQLRKFAPQLNIISPKELALTLKAV